MIRIADFGNLKHLKAIHGKYSILTTSKGHWADLSIHGVLP